MIAVLTNIALAIVLILGIILTLIGLPGNLLILLAAAAYGWQEGFVHLTHEFLLILAGLWLGGELLEFFAGAAGAKKAQASWWSTAAAFAGSITGAIAGTGLLPLVGTIAGAVLGGFAASYLTEYMLTKDKVAAIQAAKGAVKGQLCGMLIKSAIAIGMAVAIVYKLWI